MLRFHAFEKFQALNISRCTKLICSITLSAVLSASVLQAQEGELDLSFSSPFSDGVLVAGGLQSDGKIIVSGAWSIGEDPFITGILRLNSDGSIDDTFNGPGSGLNTNSIRQIIIQPDDKILICGSFTNLDGVPRRCIARLHPDGLIDQSFDPGEGPEWVDGFGTSVEAMALQPDGKIVIGGKFNTYDEETVANGVIRLNADGSLDNTFDADPAFGSEMVTEPHLSIAIQSDGKIILGGIFEYGEGAYGDDVNSLVRLNIDGSFDDTFNMLSSQNKDVQYTRHVKVDELDNIYVNGQLWGYNEQFNYVELTTRFKLNPIGTVNETHLTTSSFLSAFASSDMILLSDWKAMYSGYYNNPFGNDFFGMIRTEPNGGYDPEINNLGPISTPAGTKFLQQPDGKIICYGADGNHDGSPVIGIWRINTTLDPPCGVIFEVFPDAFNDNTLWVVPEYEGYPDLSYMWSFGDGNTSDEMFPYHTYAANGEYNLCATLTVSENGNAFCMESFCLEVSDDMTSGLISNTGETIRENGFSINVIDPNTVGISESQRNSHFEIFPNPSGGEFFVRNGLPHGTLLSFTISNSVGKIIVEDQFSARGDDSNLHAIDISNQPAGLYLLQIKSDEFHEVHRVVVH